MFKYLIEIQNRLILLTITLFSTLLICYFYKEVLLFLVIQAHLSTDNISFYFIFMNVTELFSVYLQLVFFFVLQTVLGYLFYHIFVFLSPAFFFYEYKYVNFFIKSSAFSLLFSVFLSNYYLIPFSWNFFLGFQSIQPFYFEARLNEYLAFYMNIYFLCLIYCQYSIVLFVFIVDINVNYLYIKKVRKLYYYMFLLFSTLVTPPDVFSQVFITLIMIGVYEIFLLLLIFKSFVVTNSAIR